VAAELQYGILLFFAMSILGWLMEVVCKFIEFRRFINRGFLIGPYCPIYGVGSVLIVLLLERYIASPVVAFFMAMMICGTLEYLTSYVMEKLFHARWWDYSHRRLNIDGRVCAGTLLPFGILGLMLLYVMKPALYDLYAQIPSVVLTTICFLLCGLFIADVIVSTNVLGKIRSTADLTGADDTETLTKAVREKLFGENALLRRTLQAFPYARLYNHKLLIQFKAKKQKLLGDASARKQRLQEDLKQHELKWRTEMARLKHQTHKQTGMRRWLIDQGTEKSSPSHDPNMTFPQQKKDV